MLAEEFCYTLKGFIDLNETRDITAGQWERIVDKLYQVDINNDDISPPVMVRYVVWLKGFVDIFGVVNVTQQQWHSIKESLLKLVEEVQRNNQIHKR